MARQSRDGLVPDKVVMEELKISRMTVHRWENDSKLNFPPKIKIRKRNYRSRRKYEAFKRNPNKTGGDGS
jgi:hypothetical protein